MIGLALACTMAIVGTRRRRASTGDRGELRRRLRRQQRRRAGLLAADRRRDARGRRRRGAGAERFAPGRARRRRPVRLRRRPAPLTGLLQLDVPRVTSRWRPRATGRCCSNELARRRRRRGRRRARPSRCRAATSGDRGRASSRTTRSSDTGVMITIDSLRWRPASPTSDNHAAHRHRRLARRRRTGSTTWSPTCRRHRQGPGGVRAGAAGADRPVVLIIFALLALALVIAVLGIVNTLALSVIERTREVGLLRAIGLSRRQLRRMIALESVVIAVLGALLGVVLGVVLRGRADVLPARRGPRGDQVPWGSWRSSWCCRW